ncbi:hypothetical protein LB505_013111 [Fusarium chuoi]|nr:hypothetical protein LB505_013111 [Fusarium chuoi]
MADSPIIQSTLSVISGQLCFGSLHNIWFGSSAPSQGLPVAPPQPRGTVQAHSVNYNVTAQNGAWNVFKLVSETSDAVAWFVAHEDIDPRQEVNNILRISGSPYEPDHGSTVNNDVTSRAGVFVVNRYDWSYYDKRCFDEIGEGQEEGDDDVLATFNSLGIVDRSVAQEMVQRWQGQRPSQRDSAEHGIWLYIPHGEYMFGRFGFDDTQTAARSFLFFSACTEFTRTSFLGIPGTLREHLTPQERFERQLREGVDFSGMDIVQGMLSCQYVTPPPENEQLGPYDPSEYILKEQDIESLRNYRENASVDGAEPTIHGFIDPWKQPLFNLVNEMALSYLEHFILPHLGGDRMADMAKTLFPDYERDSRPISLDVASYRYFAQPDLNPISDFDMSRVSVRLRQFLDSRSQDKSTNQIKLYPESHVRKVFLLTAIMKLIVVGATGYIGTGILRQALARSDVTSVVAVTRRPLEQNATKLQNVIVPDYGTYPPAAREAFAGAGACIWTVGVTPSHAFRMDPEEVRKGTAENQVIEFAEASDGAVEAVIAKPGSVPAQGGVLFTGLAAMSRALGIGVTEAVVLDDLAIALIDQVVHGIEKDPLWPADLNRLAQQVKDKKGLK